MSTHGSHGSVATILVYGITVFLYMSTVCPTVFPHDSGELTAAAWFLGVSHPPGFPLYNILVKMFQLLLPFGNIAFRSNIFSVITSALTVMLVYITVRDLGKKLIQENYLNIIAGCCGAFIMALFPLFWSKAIITEVYGLLALFLAILIRISVTNTGKRIMPVFFLVLFLGLGSHVSLLFLGGFMTIVLLARGGKNIPDLKLIILVFLFLIISGSVYMMLPVSAAKPCVMNWGNPSTLTRFWDHVSGTQYSDIVLPRFSIAFYTYYISIYIHQMYDQILLFPLIFIISGILAGIIHFRLAAIICAGIYVIDFLFTMLINPTGLPLEQCLIPTLVTLAIISGLGAIGIIYWLKSNRSYIVSVLVVLAVALVISGFYYKASNFSKTWTALDYGHNILNPAEPDSFVYMETENQVFVTSYIYLVEKYRDDVVLNDKLQILFPGYYEGKEMDLIQIQPVLRMLTDHQPKNTEYAYYPVGMGYRLLDREPDPETFKKAWDRVSLRGMTKLSIYEMLSDNLDAGGVFKVPVKKSKPASSMDWSLRKIRVWYWFYFAEYLRMTGESSDIIDDVYAHASSFANGLRDMHHNLGTVFNRLGRLDLALREFKLEVKTYPFSPESMINAGIIYRYLNDTDSAVQWFKKAREIDPDNPVMLKNLGLAMVNLPRYRTEGMKYLQEYIARYPDDPQAIFLKQILSE